MADFEHILQRKDGQIISAILAVDKLTENITEEMIQNLLNSLKNPGNSLEIILESNPEKAGRVVSNVILREFTSEDSSLNSIEQWKNQIKNQLEYEKGNVREMNLEMSNRYALRLCDRSEVLLCVPGENLRNLTRYYAPGGYDQIKAIDLKVLCQILTNYKDVGISILMEPTIFTRSEIENIVWNLRYLESVSDRSEEVDCARKVFANYYAMQNEQMMYSVYVSIWGRKDSLRQLSDYMYSLGYGILNAPMECIQQYQYFNTGYMAVPYVLEEKGHILPYNMQVPPACKRLNYITDRHILIRLFGLQKNDKNQNSCESSDVGVTERDHVEHPGMSEKIIMGITGSNKERVFIPLKELSKHMVIAGMSGSGKTTLLFNILYELKKKHIPFFIVEPTKTEYRQLIRLIPDMKIITPGRTDVAPIMFNPFLPPKGIALEQFLPNLIAAFQMAFTLTTPLDVILPEVIRNCYVKYDWRNDSTSDSPDVQIFGMNEFICAFKEEIERSTYDAESKQNLISGGVYRLQSLLNSNPYLFDTHKSLSMDSLLQENTLIELDAIDNPEHKTLFLSLLLLQLKLVIRKQQKKDGELKNVIMIDEAHVLLGESSVDRGKNQADPIGKIYDYLLDMVKVNRVYGTGMIFADQSLAIMKEFVNNANIKIAMHLESGEERAFLADNLNLPHDIYRNIANLAVGEYYLFYGRQKNPVFVNCIDIRSEKNLQDIVDENDISSKMKIVLQRPFTDCRCKKGCDLAIRNEADFISRKIWNQLGNLIHDEEALEKYIRLSLDDAIYSIVENSDSDNEKRLMRCAKMMTERLIRSKR